MPVESFRGKELREYGQAALRLLDIAADLESGRRRAEGLVNGEWNDTSLAQAAELREFADHLADVLTKLIRLASG
jgi:hypothetical protein